MAIFLLKSSALTRTLLRRPHLKQNLLPTKRQHVHSSKRDDPAAGTSIPVPATIANVPIWQRLGPLSRGFEAYGRSQRKRPYVTQFVSSLVIYFLGDLSAQTLNGDDYDPTRTLRALAISSGSSIISYKWFIFLGQNFNYASKTLSLATKVFVNQVTFTPIFNTYFFGMQSLLAGDSLPEVWERIKKTVPTSILNSCKLWPAVTAFSFTFVDAQYRSIFAGVIAIGWQTYLSFLNRRAEMEGSEHKVIEEKIKERNLQVREDETEKAKV